MVHPAGSLLSPSLYTFIQQYEIIALIRFISFGSTRTVIPFLSLLISAYFLQIFLTCLSNKVFAKKFCQVYFLPLRIFPSQYT